GYKIANPAVLARIERNELQELFQGYGWEPYFVAGHEPHNMHKLMFETLDRVLEEIRLIKRSAQNQQLHVRPRWPMIILESPKGWTGPRMVDGKQNEDTFRSHQIPVSDPRKHPEHLQLIEQ